MLNPAESTSSPNASASSGRSWPGSRAIGSTSAVLAKSSAAVSAGRCRASGGRRVVLTVPPAVQQSNQGREGAEGVLGVLCVLGGSGGVQCSGGGGAVEGIRGQAGRAHGASSGATIKPGTGGRGGRPRCSLRPRRFVALSAAPGSHRDAEELAHAETRRARRR